MESAPANPEIVKKLTEPTKHFLCQLKDNTYNIKFGAFRIREMTNNIILVDVKESDLDRNVTEDMDPTTRLLKYHFGPDFLRLGTIGL
jgi:hypothetical protein